MRAEDVGLSSNKLVLGKLSGRSAFKNRLEELQIELDSEQELNKAFVKFKDLADKKSEIFDEDIRAILSDFKIEETINESIKLISLKASSETGEIPEAKVTLTIDDVEHTRDATGGGPVDAAFKAIEDMVSSGAHLQLYSVSNVTEGTDSLGEVTVRLERGGRIVNGQGSDTDIVMASAKAYVNALNRMQLPAGRIHPQAYEGI
jgi:2-isopropylmalate synthase